MAVQNDICDNYNFNFYNLIEKQGLDKVLSGKVYLGNDKEPLNLKCEDDCVKYYKHLVYTTCRINGKTILRLSKKPADLLD